MSSEAAGTPGRDGVWRVERKRVFQGSDYLVWGVLLVSLLAGNLIAISRWFTPENARAHWLVFGMLTFLWFRATLYSLSGWGSLLLMKRSTPSPPPDPSLRVALVVTYVPGAEPIDVVSATMAAMTATRGTADCWILDEGDDPEVRRIAETMGVRHFTRKGRPEWNTDRGRLKARTKYGNVNAWLDGAGFESYDIVVQFDSDHAPEPHFLEKTLGYFRDPAIGYVQGPPECNNVGESWVARGAWEQDHYNKTLQQSLNGIGAPLFVGCYNISRVTALKEVGGFADHEADDALITLRLLAAGWRGVFVSEPLAYGLAPADLRTYLKQQYRWGYSLLNMKMYHERPLLARMPFRIRMAHTLHGMNYYNGIFDFLSLVLAGYFLYTGNVPMSLTRGVHWFEAFGLLALSELGVLVIRRRWFIHPSHRGGFPWRSVLLDFAARPYCFMAMFKALRKESKRYLITRKTADTRSALGFLLPHGLAGAILLALLVRSVWLQVPGTQFVRWPVAIWLALDAALFAAAIWLSATRARTSPAAVAAAPLDSGQ